MDIKKIKNELIKFFTDDPNYENERNELKKQGTITSVLTCR